MIDPLKTALRSLRYVIPLLVLALAACGPPYTIIKQSAPSALTGTTAMGVNFDFSNVAISGKRMTEEQWLASRDDNGRTTYTETKQKAADGFVRKLHEQGGGASVAAGAAPAGGVQVNVYVDFWEEGAYIGVTAWPSQIQARIQFVKDGAATDEISIQCRVDASLYAPSPHQRLNRCGEILGEFTARFMRDTTGG